MPLTNEVLLVHIIQPPPAEWLEDVRRRFPGLEVRWHSIPFTESGITTTADVLPRDVLDGVTMLCVYAAPKPETIPAVRFVQLVSAGSDRWAAHPTFLDPKVPFASAGGATPPQIAEWVMGRWLSHLHHFDAYLEQQRKGFWNTIPSAFASDSLGKKVGILGYGAIGRQCARLASALGMQVLAYTSRPRDTPESRRLQSGYTVPGTGDPDGLIPASWHHGNVDDMLSLGLDLVVLAVPLTDATRGLLGRRQFGVMRDSGKRAFIANVARGPVVDTDALIDALETGAIAGAALDVTDPEPLPEGHPLWTAPNVFITPHVSWQSTNMFTHVCAILKENLRRLDQGEELINLIDKPKS